MTENMQSVNVRLILVVGVTSALWLGVVVFAIMAWSNHTEQAIVQRDFVEPASLDLSLHRADQQALLHEHRWIDRDKGIVTIPIERAMELYVEIYNREHPVAPTQADAGKAAGPISEMDKP